ncbi:MAG TPA: isochorismate synthase [Acidimicrobiales bacterium]|nr:isochorismate synthase [Acidimicrobiales bacterium]
MPERSAGLVSRTRVVPDVGDLLDSLGHDGAAWLHDGGGLVTSGVAARVDVGPGPDRFRRAADDVAAVLEAIDSDDPLALPGTGPLAVGALPFHSGAPGELVVPAVVVGRTADGTAWVTETGRADGRDGGAPSAARGRLSPLSIAGEDGGDADGGDRGGNGRQAWTAAVHEAVARIASGPLAKVVLAREVVVDGGRPFDRREVLDRLRAGDPTSFTYAVGGFVGASPELLVRRRGDQVLSRPMAGTTTRGATPADDDRMVAALAASPKEASEHALVVGAVREALQPVCDQLTAGARPDAVRLATVTHLATSVAGHLIDPAPSALALAGLLHPTPAVGGLPRAEALAAIAELEAFDRGLYAGPVGWVDSRGDGEWAVALRCARLDGARAYLVAGAGIMADSDPDAEWAETEAKLEPMLRALAVPE